MRRFRSSTPCTSEKNCLNYCSGVLFGFKGCGTHSALHGLADHALLQVPVAFHLHLFALLDSRCTWMRICHHGSALPKYRVPRQDYPGRGCLARYVGCVRYEHHVRSGGLLGFLNCDSKNSFLIFQCIAALLPQQEPNWIQE